MASKGITDEGLPTDARTSSATVSSPAACRRGTARSGCCAIPPRRKLGGADDAARAAALVPRNGFRFGAAAAGTSTVARGRRTNVVVEGADPVSRDELLRRVGRGLYIGRIWYTYPINGLHAGDFTCTVTADSYIIRDGRIAEPLRPNTIRINDNIATF